jgi:hypothetical protein
LPPKNAAKEVSGGKNVSFNGRAGVCSLLQQLSELRLEVFFGKDCL